MQDCACYTACVRSVYTNLTSSLKDLELVMPGTYNGNTILLLLKLWPNKGKLWCPSRRSWYENRSCSMLALDCVITGYGRQTKWHFIAHLVLLCLCDHSAAQLLELFYPCNAVWHFSLFMVCGEKYVVYRCYYTHNLKWKNDELDSVEVLGNVTLTSYTWLLTENWTTRGFLRWYQEGGDDYYIWRYQASGMALGIFGQW